MYEVILDDEVYGVVFLFASSCSVRTVNILLTYFRKLEHEPEAPPHLRLNGMGIVVIDKVRMGEPFEKLMRDPRFRVDGVLEYVILRKDKIYHVECVPIN